MSDVARSVPRGHRSHGRATRPRRARRAHRRARGRDQHRPRGSDPRRCVRRAGGRVGGGRRRGWLRRRRCSLACWSPRCSRCASSGCAPTRSSPARRSRCSASGRRARCYRALFGSTGAALGIPTSAPLPIPGSRRIPVVGPALFAQPPITYLVVPARAGARLVVRANARRARASRDRRAAGGGGGGGDRRRPNARARDPGRRRAGRPRRRHAGARAGRHLRRGDVGRSRVHRDRDRRARAVDPLGVAAGALLFGAASALQFAFQAMGWDVPYQLFLVVPYLLTLAALAGAVGRARAPAALGRALGARR